MHAVMFTSNASFVPCSVKDGETLPSSVFLHGSTALVGVGLLVAEVSRSHSVTLTTLGKTTLPDNTKHSQETCIHAPGGNRTRNHSKRKAAAHALDRLATGFGHLYQYL